MDLKSLLHRLDGRSRLLVHALHSGPNNAQTVYNKQRASDPDFSLAPFLETLCQQEARVHEDALVSKPLVCLFSEVFKHKEEEKLTGEQEESQMSTSHCVDHGAASKPQTHLLGSTKVLPDHIKAAVPVIKELLDTESGWDKSSVSALKVLHECDPDEVEVLCSMLSLSEAPEQSLPQFCSCLLELSPDLSHSTASAVITNLLLNKILSLEEPASRCLVTSVMSLCTRYPRPTCQALIEPVLRKDQTGSCRAELLCKLVEDCLEPHHRIHVFRTILEVSWDEGVLLVIHALLDSKLELNEEDFSLFIDQLCSQSPHFSKSMKFAKIMLSVLTKYQSYVNAACHRTLSSCLPLNETFLKKSLLAALKRISL
nr:Fanconi anemia group E protein isoform X2 [Misgurnus anguillicaudatus]